MTTTPENTLKNSVKNPILSHADLHHLPYPDESFDVIVSNGVLHHTPDTQAAVTEVYRVLKPQGQAIIMLYCKNSWHYWINMFLLVGVFQGKIFCNPNWLGLATEWGGQKKQTMRQLIFLTNTTNLRLEVLF